MQINFHDFRIGNLFDIHPTKAYKGNDSYLLDVDGVNPVVKNKQVNNGIGGYSKLDCTEKGGIITFSDTTTADSIFYQPNDFIGYSHVQGMYPYSDEWSEDSMIYFMTLFKKAAISKGFNYGNKFTREIASNFIVSLPALDENTPNYKHMEQCISKLKIERIAKLEQYLSITGLNNYELTNDDIAILNKKNIYEDFMLKDLFIPQNGDVDLQKNHINGLGFPVVSSGVQNQGVIGKTNKPAKVIDENSITVDMFGNVFFRDFKYKMVTHARIFSLACLDEISIDAYLYLVARLNYLKEMYAYEKMCTWDKIKNDTISLPAIDKNNPDYEYMSKYINVQKKISIKNAVLLKNIMIAEN